MDDCLEQLALDSGFSYVCQIHVGLLEPMDAVRKSCAENKCRKFGTNWACPPGCGMLEECRKQLYKYKSGILVQTVGELEDEFDWEGMRDVEDRHKTHFSALYQVLIKRYPDLLALGVGPCTICRKCTYPDHACRFPQKKVSSMEAYGLLVTQVCQDNGLSYYYGKNSVSYTSCFLLK